MRLFWNLPMKEARLKQVLPAPAARHIAFFLLLFSQKGPAQLQTEDCNRPVPEKQNCPLPFLWAGIASSNLRRRCAQHPTTVQKCGLSVNIDYIQLFAIVSYDRIKLNMYGHFQNRTDGSTRTVMVMEISKIPLANFACVAFGLRLADVVFGIF